MCDHPKFFPENDIRNSPRLQDIIYHTKQRLKMYVWSYEFFPSPIKCYHQSYYFLSGKFLSWYSLSRKILSADCTTSSASSGPQTAILVLSGLQAKKAAGWWRSKLLLCFRVSETGSRSQIITVGSFESVVNTHAIFHAPICILFR